MGTRFREYLTELVFVLEKLSKAKQILTGNGGLG